MMRPTAAALLALLAAASPAAGAGASGATSSAARDVAGEASSLDADPCERWGLTCWLFDERDYFDALRADVRAARIAVLAPGLADEVPFAATPGRKLVWDISLGKDIPILGVESALAASDHVAEGEWGVGFWIPIGWHMMEDLEDDANSRPILNTDYRFAFILKGAYGWSGATRLGASLGWGHESTHLGDEFSLAAARTHPDFRRINVSYEAVRYGVGVEQSRWGGILRLRHDGVYLTNPGWYSADPRETGGLRVTPPERKYEPSLGVEYLSTAKWWPPIVSLDARRRVVFDYDRPSADTPEDTQWSYNLVVGFPTQMYEINRLPATELYLRLYHGVNPHGQFRSQRHFTIFGVGLMVEL